VKPSGTGVNLPVQQKPSIKVDGFSGRDFSAEIGCRGTSGARLSAQGVDRGAIAAIKAFKGSAIKGSEILIGADQDL
jgi:hypothetical protein